MKSIATLFFLQLIFNNVQSVQIGSITNASWMAPPSSTVIVSGSCNECICIMLNSYQSIVSLNCYKNNGTCQFFFSYTQIIIYQMVDNPDTIFYFSVLPPIPITSLFWPFDGSINEIYNRADATSNSNILFISPGIYGRGSAIYLNRSQYLNMTSAYLNVSWSSFTFEMWIYPFSLKNSSTDGLAILGQCQYLNASNCLHMEIRSVKPFLGFYSNDCSGQTALMNKTWYHLGFVYDAIAQKQSIFLNGKRDCYRTATALRMTYSNPLTIGIDLFVPGGSFRYFNGYMDQLSYVNRAKNISEILDDATLIVYFSFNQGSLFDSGPNQMNGTANELIFINNAILFNQTYSSFQIETFDSSDIFDSSSSIVFWINPSSINGSTIVHVLFNINTNMSSSLDMIGFDNQGHLISQIQTNETIFIIGPLININIWTHVAQTYSLINGLKLYINGTFINGTGPIFSMNIKQTQTITLGNCLQSCGGTGVILDSPYVGLIDEFRIYSRELNSSDIQALIYR